MSGAVPVTQPSEQYCGPRPGPNGFAQLWDRISVRFSVTFVSVPGHGSRTLPLGLPVVPFVHRQQPRGIGPCLGMDVHAGLFRQFMPSPLFPDAIGISTGLLSELSGAQVNRPEDILNVHPAKPFGSIRLTGFPPT